MPASELEPSVRCEGIKCEGGIHIKQNRFSWNLFIFSCCLSPSFDWSTSTRVALEPATTTERKQTDYNFLLNINLITRPLISHFSRQRKKLEIIFCSINFAAPPPPPYPSIGSWNIYSFLIFFQLIWFSRLRGFQKFFLWIMTSPRPNNYLEN